MHDALTTFGGLFDFYTCHLIPVEERGYNTPSTLPLTPVPLCLPYFYFLLETITQCCQMFLNFFCCPPPWESGVSASCLTPPLPLTTSILSRPPPPLFSRTFYSQLQPPFVVVSGRLFYFYCKTNPQYCHLFSQFLPVPSTFRFPLSALSSPAFRALSSPILPWFRPLTPPIVRQIIWFCVSCLSSSLL